MVHGKYCVHNVNVYVGSLCMTKKYKNNNMVDSLEKLKRIKTNEKIMNFNIITHC